MGVRKEVCVWCGCAKVGVCDVCCGEVSSCGDVGVVWVWVCERCVCVWCAGCVCVFEECGVCVCGVGVREVCVCVWCGCARGVCRLWCGVGVPKRCARGWCVCVWCVVCGGVCVCVCGVGVREVCVCVCVARGGVCVVVLVLAEEVCSVCVVWVCESVCVCVVCAEKLGSVVALGVVFCLGGVVRPTDTGVVCCARFDSGRRVVEWCVCVPRLARKTVPTCGRSGGQFVPSEDEVFRKLIEYTVKVSGRFVSEANQDMYAREVWALSCVWLMLGVLVMHVICRVEWLVGLMGRPGYVSWVLDGDCVWFRLVSSFVVALLPRASLAPSWVCRGGIVCGVSLVFGSDQRGGVLLCVRWGSVCLIGGGDVVCGSGRYGLYVTRGVSSICLVPLGFGVSRRWHRRVVIYRARCGPLWSSLRAESEVMGVMFWLDVCVYKSLAVRMQNGAVVGWELGEGLIGPELSRGVSVLCGVGFRRLFRRAKVETVFQLSKALGLSMVQEWVRVGHVESKTA
uniref:Uncharacterized protein n=1 Tax=Parascaris univalens TaxID=6257 RepID=A0A915BLH3_PARUN